MNELNNYDIDNRIKILIVEDDRDFAFLIKQELSKEPDFQCVGIATNSREAIKLSCQYLPRIVIMDLNLSILDFDGVELSKEIRLQTGAQVIILTSMETELPVEYAVKKAFAADYLYKSQFSILCGTVRYIANGTTPHQLLIRKLILQDLSTAEQSVLDMIMGKNIEIKSANKTISNQKTSILKKLGLKNTAQLIKLFR